MNRLIKNLMYYGSSVVRVAFFAVLLIVGLSGASRAKAASSNWQVSLPVTITGGAYYTNNGVQVTVADAV